MSSVCLSVRLSVTLVDCDHIGWNSSKIISRLVSVGRSLSADLNIRGLLQGNTPEIFWPKVTHPLLETFDRKLRPNGYRWSNGHNGELIGNHTIALSMVPYRCPLDPYDLPFPPKWGSICPQHTRMAISLQRVIRSTSCLVLG